VQRISGRRREIELLVILPRLIILGVNRQSADAGDICRLQGAQIGVAEKGAAVALLLPVLVTRREKSTIQGSMIAESPINQN